MVSPHCDDAVFACGDLLAACPGAIVVTVFAGRPASYGPVTPWDAACGFRAGDDVMRRRRAEDRDALRRLGATPVWLDFCDAQYGAPPHVGAVARVLDAAIAATRPTAVFAPLGLFHSDHALAHAAALRVRARRPRLGWFLYEDAMYRRIPRLLDARLGALRAAGLSPARAALAFEPRPERKVAAVACYRSQLRALARPGYPGYADAFEREGYWRIDG